MHRKNEKAFSKKELKHANRERVHAAKFHAKKYDIAAEETSTFLLSLIVKSLSPNKPLPFWLTTYLLLNHLTNEANSTLQDNTPKKQMNACALPKQSTFFSKTNNINPAATANNFTVQPCVYQSFPGCTKIEVDNYLALLSQEATQTHAFSKEIKKTRSTTKPYKVKFKSTTASLFEERGITDHVTQEITIFMPNHPAQISAREHHAIVSTYRHEEHHEWKAHTNKRQIPCLTKNNIQTNSWIAHPYLPAESTTHLSAWANTIKLGLTRLEHGKIAPEIISLYRPRIWLRKFEWNEKQIKKIEEDITSKAYCNLVIDFKEKGQFPEIEKIFSVKAQRINIYALKIEEKVDGTYPIWYSYVRNPEDTAINRLLHALAWDIKGRIFQYQNDPQEGKRGFGYNIAEIDAFLAGLHRDITHTVFPEWVDFHKKSYQEAMRCNETSSQASYKRNEL